MILLIGGGSVLFNCSFTDYMILMSKEIEKVNYYREFNLSLHHHQQSFIGQRLWRRSGNRKTITAGQFGFCIVNKHGPSIQDLQPKTQYHSIKHTRYENRSKIDFFFFFFTLPFIFVTALSASSCDAKVTNPKPFGLSETLSITTLAGRRTGN